MTKTYAIKNLSCAQCAAGLEEALNRRSDVRSAEIQFINRRLVVDTDHWDDVQEAIRFLEPEVTLSAEDSTPSLPSADTNTNQSEWILLTLSTFFLMASFLFAEFHFSSLFVWGTAGLAYASAGWSVVRAAFRGVRHGRFFDETVLMTIATAAAWALGAVTEAAAVMVFFQWGETLQSRAARRSRKSLEALLAGRQERVRVTHGGKVHWEPPESVEEGTEFEVRGGERVALDGRVVTGRSSVDTSALTGESFPRPLSPGDAVQAGWINQGGVLTVRSVGQFEQTAWSRLSKSVEEALAHRPPLERFLTRFAQKYTPAVLAASAVLFGILVLTGLDWHQSLYRSLVLLVVSCPCALLLSVPLTYLGAVGAASGRGWMVRDAGVFDRLARVNEVAFDKTGTLSRGRPQLKAVEPSQTEEALRACLDAGLAGSGHPLASAWGSTAAAPPQAQEFHGQGVVFLWKGEQAGVGRLSFLREHNFPTDGALDDDQTCVHAASESAYWGRAVFDDPPKEGVASTLAELRAGGVRRLALLSGDTVPVVERWREQFGFDETVGGLLPEGKQDRVLELQQNGGRVLFVGDGLNDAPVLASAWVSVSLGQGASDVAAQTADVALRDGDPRQIPTLLRLSRRTRAVLWQNVVLVLGLKFIFASLGTVGLTGLWEAVFADGGVALLAVANALRIKPVR